MYYHIFQTSLGNIGVLGGSSGLTHLFLDAREAELGKQAIKNSSFFQDTEKQIHEYLSGKRKTFDIKLDPHGTDFQKKVWNQLVQIEYGSTQSYKDIAEKSGSPRGYRAVGMANNKNPIPIIIPCHRVIGSNGKLTGYAYGENIKQHLLDLESKNKSLSSS